MHPPANSPTEGIQSLRQMRETPASMSLKGKRTRTRQVIRGVCDLCLDYTIRILFGSKLLLPYNLGLNLSHFERLPILPPVRKDALGFRDKRYLIITEKSSSFNEDISTTTSHFLTSYPNMFKRVLVFTMTKLWFIKLMEIS